MGSKLTQQRAELRTEEAVGRTEDRNSKGSERQSLATAVIHCPGAFDPACALEGGHEL